MDDSKLIEQMVVSGDSWMRFHGIISPLMHNNIILVLYSQFPKIEYLEYFISGEDSPEKFIKLNIYLKLWDRIFIRKRRFINSIFDVLKEYLPNHNIYITLKPYKRSGHAGNV